jgi:hypothetical protein
MRYSWTKNAFWDVDMKKRRNWNKFVSSFLSNNCYGLPVLTKNIKSPSQVFYGWFVHVHSCCAKFGQETWFSPNDDIRKCLLDIKHGWIKNAFWNVNNKEWRKLCMFVSPSLFNNTSAYLWSQCTPNVQIKYLYLILANRGWKLDHLQTIIFVNVSSTWIIVKLKRGLKHE